MRNIQFFLGVLVLGCSPAPIDDGESPTEGSSSGAGPTDGSEPTGGTGSGTTTEVENDSTASIDPVCGDGIIQDEEVCDDAVNDGSYGGCQADCGALGPHCGDRLLSPEEICDDSDGIQGNGCNADCTISGSELWLQSWDHGGATRVLDVAVLANNDILLATLDTDLDATFLRRHSAGGDLSAELEVDELSQYGAVAPDGSYALATPPFGDPVPRAVRSFTAAHQQVWEHDFPGGVLTIETVLGGGLVVGDNDQDQPTLTRFDGRGAIVWERPLQASIDRVFRVAPLAAGGVATIGYNSISDGILVQQWANDGAPVWSEFIGTSAVEPPDAIGAIVSDETGVVACWSSNMTNEVIVTRFDLTGALEWSHLLLDEDVFYWLCSDLALADNGDIIIVGTTQNPSAGARVTRMTPAGEIQWTTDLDDNDVNGSVGSVVTQDTDGNIIVGGWSPSDGGWLLKLRP